jgi:tetratricopeptide (TPR) repeat protein
MGPSSFWRAVRIFALSAATSSATACLASAQTDQDMEWCNGQGNATTDQSISGCTAMVDSGAYKGEELAIIFNNRAMAYFKRAEFQSAIQDFDQAIGLRPNFLSALISRGFACLRLKNYDAAAASFDAALQTFPANPASLYGRALARAKGDRVKAGAELAAVRQSDPSIAQELAPYGVDLEPPQQLVTVSPSAPPVSAPSAPSSPAPRSAGETAALPPAAAAATRMPVPSEAATSSSAPAEETASLPLPAEVTAALVQRGNDLLRTGDIVAARLAFERAAAAGDKIAALGVAKTFDPVFLAQNGVRGLRGDPARAVLWYGKAVAAGSREAEERLTRLRAQFPQ